MPTLNYSVSVSGLGLPISRSQPRSADGGSSRDVAVPKGYAGTCTTRTDANTGTITLANGHSITTGMAVDLYFTGADGLPKVQYDVTVGTVATNSMPFDGGIGDDLRASTGWAVVVSPRVQVNLDVDGDNLSLLAIQQKYPNLSVTSYSHIDFQDADDDEIAELDLAANGPQVFDVTGGGANPFTGDPITKAFVSNGSSATDATLLVAWLQDSTP